MNKFSKGLLLSLALVYSHEILATERLVVWEDVGRASTIESAVKDFEKIYDCDVDVLEKPMYHQVELLEKQGPKGEGPDVVVFSLRYGWRGKRQKSDFSNSFYAGRKQPISAKFNCICYF